MYQEIARTGWRDFLDGFTRVHLGWLVTVELADGGGVLMRDVPLAGIVLDGGNIVIEAAMDRHHTDHVVRDPVAVRVDRTADGADRQLELAGRDGSVVHVRFRTAIRSELVDGIANAGRP